MYTSYSHGYVAVLVAIIIAIMKIKDHKGYGSAAMFPKKLSEHFNFICTTVLYKYMKSHRNDVLNYSDNMHE
jgi:hypothetical protein